jgi:hypothetical protein
MLAEREAGNVAGLAMLRGKEIPYKDEGRGVLLDALLSPVQATIARHETQAGYQEAEPASEPIRYHSYDEFPARYWK